MTTIPRISRAAMAAVCVLFSSAVMAQGRFSYSADGAEVIDNETSLIWRRCSEGQSWSGGTCAGTATGFGFEEGAAHVQTQAGWRLPNVKELNSIVDRRKTAPALDSEVFPATELNWYWSSTGWIVNFYNGLVYHGARNPLKYMRLVRQ